MPFLSPWAGASAMVRSNNHPFFLYRPLGIAHQQTVQLHHNKSLTALRYQRHFCIVFLPKICTSQKFVVLLHQKSRVLSVSRPSIDRKSTVNRPKIQNKSTANGT